MGLLNRALVKNTYISMAPTAVYTVTSPVLRTQLITTHICNSSSGDASFTAWIVPLGGTPSNQNIWLKEESVLAGGRFINIETTVLEQGDSFYVQADVANALSIHLSGNEIA